MITLFNPAPALTSSSVEKLSEIKNTIKSKLMKVKKDKKKEKSLQVKISNIKKNIGSQEEEIKKFKKGIASTNKGIKKLSGEIDLMTGNMENRKEVVKEYIKAIHRRKINSDMIMLVSAADYQDFIKKSRYISLIADHNSKIIHAYKEDLDKIHSKKKELVELQTTLTSNKTSASKKKKKLQLEKKKKGELISKVRSRRMNHEKKIKELELSSKKLQRMVTRLRSKKIPGAIIGSGFKSQKGSLPWPANGKVISPFGKYKDKYNVLVNKNGIDIRVMQGENPKAIAGGRVVFKGNFEGYGNLLIIDHGNGFHSLYGNLYESSIQESSLLVEGMDVGSIRASKKNSTPLLYFEIRHKGRPVDPMKWLQRRS
jgi:septal ring factor EnvC (AmiA/AmiB activator)